VSGWELFVALRAGVLQLVIKLDVLVPQAVRSEPFVAVGTPVNLENNLDTYQIPPKGLAT
jgi:hypothetical protein